MKIAAICLVFCLCTGIGIYKSFAVGMRTAQLRLILECFRSICAELKYSKTSAEGLREVFSEYSSVPLFAELAKIRDLSPKAAYERAWSSASWRMYITLSDRAILDRFFENFGKDGTETQLQLCSRTVEELQDACKDSQLKSDKYSRLYAVFGFMAGLFFILILA